MLEERGAGTERGAGASLAGFPPTRYQGSKRRLLPWIGSELAQLDFHSALDLFSGTASVSYLLKVLGKQVTCNDLLDFNRVTAEALVVNDDVQLAPDLLAPLSERVAGEDYHSLIAEEFAGIFYLDEENSWLDTVAQNIDRQLEGAPRSLALFALYQACLAKRPFNLFHRANLAMRTREVKRSFGNKKTWDRPFMEHFQTHLRAANGAVFDSGLRHRALCGDYLEVEGDYDLVYLDPPYTSSAGKGVDYLDFYHFLEGLTDYAGWRHRLDRKYKHRPFRRDTANPWRNPARVGEAFASAFDRYRDSILVVSYRSDGLPSVEELRALLQTQGRRGIRVVEREHKYALARRPSREVLLISEPAS